ncbi:GNAT family N-acetyltransferase [Aquibacillus sediminis]|uniref:GNAT family N-acetyltransferase n=1 Tax=Aquibacillus sediminis TaxID=2574734 RepID=UPI0011091FE2|nr:GNAT family protein [Aquibacillus sediminis]
MITLRYFDPSDYDQLIKWIDSPSLLVQWGGSSFEFPLTKQQLQNYLFDANKDQAKLYAYSVVDQQTGNVIGHISLGDIDRKNNSGRIGRVLVGDETIRGKGIGKQMIKSILEIAFNDMRLHRVSLGVFDFNTPAIRCYEKVGFVKEGVKRDAQIFGNTYWNLWEMSMLEDEWKAEQKNELVDYTNRQVNNNRKT